MPENALPSPSDPVLLVVSTFPNEIKARQIGTALIGRQLAACVNLLPSAFSIYRWEEAIQNETETFALFKTTRSRHPEFVRELASLHPYDIPEIITLEPADVAPAYARWVGESCRGGKF